MTNQEKTTKGFFHKTLKNFTKLLSGGYRKIPKPSTLRPFSCGSLRERGTKEPNKMDRFYCDEWQCEFEPPGNMKAEKSIEKWAEGEKEVKVAERKDKQGVGGLGHRAEELELARKMKEMEMADAGDVEQVLDIEEALHYYSRLKSPVYVEIVDKFFMDMYDNFSAPPSSPRLRRIQHPAALSKCVTGSRRRLGSIRF